MKGFLADLGFGARVLRRSPAFALTAMLALGLGTGATTAIFTVLEAVVLRPLPYPAADRLVMLWDTNHEKALEHEPISPVTFLDYRGLGQVFADAAAWWRPEMTLLQPGLDPLRVDAVETSRNLFDVVGVHPQLGPGFPSDGPLHQRGVQEVVISHRLWRARFGGDPALVGRSISLGGELFTVVGIMPPGFTFPGQTDVWQRLRWDLAQHSRGAHFMEAVARLAPGVTPQAADRELNALTARLGKEFPATNAGWNARATPLLDEVVGYFRPALFVLMASVALLLLIACVNVANLLLARATTRAREVALRAAIGASRRRLVGQFLAESLVLAAGGTALGLLIAWAGVKVLGVASPIRIPRLEAVGVDARVLLFTAGLAILTAIVFGLVPALLASRTDLQQALREGGRGTGGGAARRVRQALVVGEVALSVALLVAAGLVMRSVDRLVREDPGLKPGNILTASLNLPSNTYRDWTQVARFYEDLTDALRRQPGVEAATTSNFLPLATGWRIPFAIEGRPPVAAEDRPQAQYHTVGTGYFATLGVPLMAGRTFDTHDTLDSRGVVVLNEAMARRFWPDGGALGAKVRALTKYIGPLGVRLADSDEYEVVGIVGNVKNTSLQREAEPAMYFSIYQFPFREMYVQIRGRAAPETLLTALRREVRARDAALPISKVRTMESVLGASTARPKFLMALMSGFAVLALTLAAVGIYGILAYAVTERTREIGIRVALGARGTSVVWLVVRQGLALSGLGVAVGAVAAYFGGRTLSAVLYDVQPADPLTSTAVLGLVLVVSLVACWVPAHRAAKLDPLVALREE
jgi:putative ABC transport system permease protein